jgi:hypothetical protein
VFGKFGEIVEGGTMHPTPQIKFTLPWGGGMVLHAQNAVISGFNAYNSGLYHY